MENIAKAILEVMGMVQGIDKDMNVGTGGSSYKGVSDKSVKLKVGEAMRKAGLVILPTKVTPRTEVTRWEETSQYGSNPPQTKQKQQVFTEVTTEYLLLHKSGESIKLEGYGHGVDSQDKGAGKATTYALKYTLLYTFLIATGHIDDADKDHSDELDVPKNDYLISWQDQLDGVKNLAEIAAFYKGNKQAVDSDPAIKALFTKRKGELQKP